MTDVDKIATELASTARPTATPSNAAGGWRSSVATLPGIGLSLLPKIACPACWPAYTGVLASLGLGSLTDIRLQLPLTAVFLLIAVGALTFRARQRRGFGPAWVGAAAAIVVLGGKFGFGSDPAMHAGLVLLVAASIWNTWPRRVAPACPGCADK